MKVLGQDDPCVNHEGVTLSDFADHAAQEFDMPCEQIVVVALEQIHSEKVSAARLPGASVIRHLRKLPEVNIRCKALRLLHPT